MFDAPPRSFVHVRGDAVRTSAATEGFRVKAVAGTHVVLLSLDCDAEQRKGLLGFAIRRDPAVGGSKWLRSTKVFPSVVAHPETEHEPDRPPAPHYSNEHPIQSFLWSDYACLPGTAYTFVIVPMYGAPGDLEPGTPIELRVRTERSNAGGHGIWFNRGAIASQAFAEEFDNVGPHPPGDPDPKDDRTAWLSRGLLDACLRFIRTTPAGWGLRVAAYELTYVTVITELRKALDRGVDVRIVYKDTTHEDEHPRANEDALAAASLTARRGGRKILHPRSKCPGIPHNKFIVRLDADQRPISVWTGSTNFTPSGFLGQTNVGHLVTDHVVAATYLEYWKALSRDPDREQGRATAVKLTPDLTARPTPNATTLLFSPRPKATQLTWYSDRIKEGVDGIALTAAFGVTPKMAEALEVDSPTPRFVLMEKPPPDELAAALTKNRDVDIAFGDVLGDIYVFTADGEPTSRRRRITGFELDKWFLKEDHYRPTDDGHVFFIHTKFLLVDPLSNDPLVCTGSANFSPNSVLDNDENMLIIRGNTRVADIYLTEFERIFRHFQSRNVTNRIAGGGRSARGAKFLREDDSWTRQYFRATSFKSRRREMFFADPNVNWASDATPA